MSKKSKNLRARLQYFCKSNTGSSSVEAVIWVPIIVYLMVMIADFSMVFYGKAEALRIVQNSNRALSVGHVTTTDAVENLVRAGMAISSDQLSVDTSITDGIIMTVLNVPASEYTAIGSVPGLNNVNITVTSQHFLEQ